MELKKYKLGEILDVTRGASLSGEFYATEGKYIRLTCGNFDYQNNCFKENKSKDNLYYIGDFKPEFLMEEGDIITPLTEQAIGLLGSTAIIPESGKYIQSQDVAKIICKEELLDKDFAFYLISSTLVKQQLSAAAQQTKIRHTSPDKIRDCTVWIPELTEQKRIGKLLRSLDRKIELNRAINQNLEAMAKQLYDYWFVQFDFPDENGRPYKSSGGKMVWNEKLKREIPERWEINPLQDICHKIQSGGTPSTSRSEYYEGDICWYSTQELSDKWLIDSIKHISKEAIDNSSTKIFPANSVIIAIYAAPTVGRLGILSTDACFNQACCGFIPKEDIISKEYLFLTLLSLRNQLNVQAVGACQKNLSVGFMNMLEVLVPKASVMRKWTDYVQLLYTQMLSIDRQISMLTKQRDELLPLLMNGQVSVNSDLSAH